MKELHINICLLNSNLGLLPGYEFCSYECEYKDHESGCKVDEKLSDEQLHVYMCYFHHGDECNNVPCSPAGLSTLKSNVEVSGKKGEGNNAKASRVSVVALIVVY